METTSGESASTVGALTLPPGPDLPADQQARLWIERPLELLDACAARFGDVFTLELGANGPTVMFGDPAGIREIFRTPASSYECRPFNEGYRIAMGDHALFLQDGSEHRRIKCAATSALGHEGMESHALAIARTAAEMFDAALGDRQEATIAPRPLFHEMAVRMLAALIFGDRREAADRMVAWFRAEVWRDTRAWKPWVGLHRLRPRLVAWITDELNLRRSASGSDRTLDLLDRLLTAHDADGRPLSDAEIIDQVRTLTITAVDPIAFALTWLLAHVAAAPGVQNTARAEVEMSLGDARTADPSEIVRLPYLSAISQELLRMHPVLPTASGRRLTEAREFAGHKLPAGATAAPCAYLVHRRPELYPEPMTFRPERFLEHRFGLHEYLPFGGGARRCLGTTLAPMSMQIVLALVVSRWQIAPGASGGADIRYGTLVGPPEGLTIRFAPR